MRKQWSRLLIALIAFGPMLLPLSTQAQAQAQTTDPLSVVKAFIEAYNQGNVDQTLAYFSDNAIVKLNPAPPTGGSFSGKEQIRSWLQNAVNNNSHLEVVGTLQVSGDKVTGVSRLTGNDLKRIGVDFLEDNVETTVINGKITSNIVTTTPASLAKLPRQGGNSTGSNQGQGGVASTMPQGAPSAGGGGTETFLTNGDVLAWLIGLLLCGSLAALVGLKLARQRR